MSKFAVTVEIVESVHPHPNADRLEIAKLCGINYNLVVGKGVFDVGNGVIYFPLDSVLPDKVLSILGLSGKLSGKNKNVVKTVKLRGVPSQGIIAHVAEFYEYWSDYDYPSVGYDVTNVLGVTKYEPQIVITKSGNLHKLPSYVKKYDIENAERYPDIVELLLDIPVCITEKVEGSHWACSLDSGGNVHVLQRNYEIITVEGKQHTWWKVFEEGEFSQKLRDISYYYHKHHGKQPNNVTIRGEIIGPGIQGNYYKLDKHKVLVFEIEIDGKPIDVGNKTEISFGFLTSIVGIETVPFIFTNYTLREFLSIPYPNSEAHNRHQKLSFLSNGRSTLRYDVLREGIVIKPTQEIYNEKFGRVFIKQRSPEYLAK